MAWRNTGEPHWPAPRDWIVAAAVLAAAALFFAWRMHGMVDATYNSGVFGADHDENLVALGNHRYWGLGYAKHFGAVLWAFATVAPLQAIGVPTPTAAIAGFALALGIGHGAQYLALRAEGLAPGRALAAILLTVSGYAYVTAAAAIDIYGMALAAIWLGLAIAKLAAPRLAGARRTLALGAAAGLAGAVNLPGAAYALVQPDGRPPRAADAARIAIALGIALAPLVLLGALTGYSQQRAIVSQWASFANFTNGAVLRDFLAGALAFALVAPKATIQCRHLAADFGLYAGDPARLLALAGWGLLVAGGLAVGLREQALRWRTLSIVAAVGAMLVFYIFFAPQAVLLFSVQWLPGLILLLAPLLARSRAAVALALVTALLGLAVNLPVLGTLRAMSADQSCPPALEVNGGL